jgi:hypothetical protein
LPAATVAERIIGDLEAIEVETKNCEAFFEPPCTANSRIDAIAK